VAGVALSYLSGHVDMLLLLRRGFLGVGSTVRRMLRGEEMGQNKPCGAEGHTVRFSMTCTPCVGE
jgi:hypothetical protein